MGKYNWTIDTLIRKLKLIEKLIEKETDENKLRLLQNDYIVLQNDIEDYFDNTQEDMCKLLEGYECIKDSMGKIPFLWHDFQEFAEITYDPINTPNLKRCNLSKDDLLEITHDFYKSLNHFFFGNFMKNFYRRNDHISFKGYDNISDIAGMTISLPSLKESYIEIFRNYTIDDVLTTIHEYSHATSVSINPYHLINQPKIIYTEIDSLFMELIASDFIDSLMHSKNAPIFRANELNQLSCSADSISSQIDLIEAEKFTKNGYENNKILKRIAEEHCELNSFEVEDLLNYPDIYSSTYLTSFMFALELYKMYQKDKEKALYYLKKIILLDNLSEEQYYCNIKRFGIIPNLSLNAFYKECKNDVMKLTRKKSKPRK